MADPAPMALGTNQFPIFGFSNQKLTIYKPDGVTVYLQVPYSEYHMWYTYTDSHGKLYFQDAKVTGPAGGDSYDFKNQAGLNVKASKDAGTGVISLIGNGDLRNPGAGVITTNPLNISNNLTPPTAPTNYVIIYLTALNFEITQS